MDHRAVLQGRGLAAHRWLVRRPAISPPSTPEAPLQIRDRAKDLIKSGGEWISSIDLENAAVGHAAVAMAAVIGVKHPRWEERPLLFIVRKPQCTLEREEILAYLAAASGQMVAAGGGDLSRFPPRRGHRQGAKGAASGALRPPVRLTAREVAAAPAPSLRDKGLAMIKHLKAAAIRGHAIRGAALRHAAAALCAVSLAASGALRARGRYQRLPCASGRGAQAHPLDRRAQRSALGNSRTIQRAPHAHRSGFRHLEDSAAAGPRPRS